MKDLPSITDYCAAISGWIASCTNKSQICVCRDAIDNFLYKRFKDTDHVLAYANALNEQLLKKENSLNLC